jgi:hypothetical protein
VTIEVCGTACLREWRLAVRRCPICGVKLATRYASKVCCCRAHASRWWKLRHEKAPLRAELEARTCPVCALTRDEWRARTGPSPDAGRPVAEVVRREQGRARRQSRAPGSNGRGRAAARSLRRVRPGCSRRGDGELRRRRHAPLSRRPRRADRARAVLVPAGAGCSRARARWQRGGARYQGASS